MVDPALLRQAADRGVTICFADLDGADGLWVPEERTVLVSRRLSEREVAEVIAHELAHVAIDDQHADLDAGRDVRIGHPVRSGRSRVVAVAVTASALFAVVGGVSFGLANASGDPVRPEPVVAPSPGGSVATAPQAPAAGDPMVRTTPSWGADGRIVVITITLTATPSVPAGSSPVARRSSTAPVPRSTSATTTAPPPARPSGTRKASATATAAPATPSTLSPTPSTAAPSTVPSGVIVLPGPLPGPGSGDAGD